MVWTAEVSIDCGRIHDWASFHDEFAKAFGFPDFYGRNMDAWIDCLTSLDEPDDLMTAVHCQRGSVMTLELKGVKLFQERCPEQYQALIHCAESVNRRRIEVGETAVLALRFSTQ